MNYFGKDIYAIVLDRGGAIGYGRRVLFSYKERGVIVTKRKVFSLIGLVLSVYLIINMLFVPFVQDEPLWELGLIGYDHIVGIIMLIELVLGIIALIMQLFGLTQKANFVHFGNGFYFSYHLYIFIEYLDHDVLDNAQIGLWLGLIVSALLFLVIFIGGFLKNEKNEKPKLTSYK